MSDEITQNGSMKIDSSGQKFTRKSGNVKITQTNQGQSYVVQHVGGAWEAIDLGDITEVGCYFFRNLEASGGAYVRVGADYGGTDYAFLRLHPQDISLGRLDPTDTSAPKAVAEDSAGVFLESWILDN